MLSCILVKRIRYLLCHRSNNGVVLELSATTLEYCLACLASVQPVAFMF